VVLIKTKQEQKGIMECCKIVAEVLNSLDYFIKPGLSTKDLENEAKKIISKHQAKSAFKGYSVPGLPPFPGYVCTSPNSCIVHGIPSKNIILEEGDLISVDVGVTKNGYFGDAAKTYAVGSVSEQAKCLMKVTADALLKGISQAKAGLNVGHISYSIGSFVSNNGYFIADQLTGHGVGKSLHEEPMIPNIGFKGAGMKLSTGMTLAIEPMVNIGTSKVLEKGWEFFAADNSLSAHFEHTILITEDEPIILTK